jgi:uncharacterized protein YdaU (DUF1376 family)
MKDPAFLFYPNDYIGGTLGLTFEQKGAYVELLMMQFNRGHMTYDMIAQMLGQKMDNIWSAIENKFKIDENGLYFNERLELEQNKRKAYSDSRRNNISGKNQHSTKDVKPKKDTKKDIGHMTSHMEDVNVIYSLYPSKCYIKERSTGKCQKNKEQIKSLLKTKSVEELTKIINLYLNDCKVHNTYLKNFTTFFILYSVRRILLDRC